jgi:trigger factor
MSYTSSIEEVNSTRRKFRISVDKAVVTEQMAKAVDEVQKTAQLKGFRKGKVPSNLVRKFYSQDVRKKALESVINETYRKAAEESKLQIVSYPNIEPVGTFEDGDNFVFDATVDVNPAVEIKGFKGLKVQVEKSKLPDVETQISETRQKFLRNAGRLEVATDRVAAAKDDVVSLDFRVLDGAVPVSGQQQNGARIALDGTNLPAVETGLIGAKVGETVAFPVTFPESHPESLLKGKTLTFEAKINQIEELKLPDLDATFVNKFGFETVEGFENSLRETVTNSIKKQRMALIKDELLKQILEANPFDVPESLVDSTVDRAISDANSRRAKGNQLKQDDPQVRAGFRDWALAEVRGVLALGHIARGEKVEVDEAAVAKEIGAFAAENGLAPQEVFRRFGTQVIEEFRGKVLVDKVVEIITEQAIVEEV